MNLGNATTQEVFTYLYENKITVDEAYTDGDDVYWACSTGTGFSTFDFPMNEEQAYFASFLFHQLCEKGVWFGDAERLAQAYVMAYKVMQKPISEDEQEQIRQQLLNAIESGNVGFAGENNNDYE